VFRFLGKTASAAVLGDVPVRRKTQPNRAYCRQWDFSTPYPLPYLTLVRILKLSAKMTAFLLSIAASIALPGCNNSFIDFCA
jgi:hypothetical protein